MEYFHRQEFPRIGDGENTVYCLGDSTAAVEVAISVLAPLGRESHIYLVLEANLKQGGEAEENRDGTRTNNIDYDRYICLCIYIYGYAVWRTYQKKGGVPLSLSSIRDRVSTAIKQIIMYY